MATVLIAGCGYVGSALANLLLNQQHTVYGIRRHVNLLPIGVRPLAVDLSSLQAEDLPSPIDYVFYLAAADEHTESAYYQAYQAGLANLLTQLQKARQPVKRIFFSSSTAVYGQTQGEWVDEASETKPKGFSGKILLEAEQTLLTSGFSSVIVRFGGIYGPGRDRLIRSVLENSAQLSQEPVYTNRIHQADCAGMLCHLMQLSKPEKIYLGVDSEPALKNEVLIWLAKQLNKPLAEIASVQLEHALRGNKRCSNQRLLASGYQLIYPTFREGYITMLRSQC